jgi:putative phosphoribosyl transferase
VNAARGHRLYRDRNDAGLVLARHAARHAYLSPVTVLALPRGGVPVAAPVARRLAAALQVCVVRKLGVPGRPELAMGALALVNDRIEVIRNEPVIAAAQVSPSAFQQVRDRESAELERRAAAGAGGLGTIVDRSVVVVDDGLATGMTMLAAVTAIRRRGPAEIVVAVPVGSRTAIERLRSDVEAVVCPMLPVNFMAVGQAYRDFTQVSDDEVRQLLAADYQ